MYCPRCREAIPDVSVTCPRCGVQIYGAGAGRQAAGVPSGRLLSTSTLGAIVAGVLTLAAAWFVIVVSCGMLARVAGKSLPFVPRSEWAEGVVQAVRHFVRTGKPGWLPWVALPVAYVLALVAVFGALDTVEKLAWFRHSVFLRRGVMVFLALVLGLFAVRVRVELFNSLGGSIDWGLNGVAMAVGMAAAITVLFTRD